ncbi:MAG: DUF5683 domain-containing protein [Bacteroidales bacterium]|jgi:hypothetical protein|nr:DUF5683 domain-containing protein [Bacteroidales bacterium]
MKRYAVSLFILLITLSFSLRAQVDTAIVTADHIITADHNDTGTDTTVNPKKHSPRTAALLSFIPGGGQIYNKKWWKVPIIYAGLGASSYCIYHYGKLTRIYQLEYRYRMSADTTLRALCNQDPEWTSISDQTILTTKNAYQRSLEIAIAATVIIYVLNFIDALVDAHLFDFDVSDKLSLRIAPALLPNMQTGRHVQGISICLRF